MNFDTEKKIEFRKFLSTSKNDKRKSVRLPSDGDEERNVLKILFKKKIPSSASSRGKPNKFLEAERKLPPKYHNIFSSSKLAGLPLEEIDEYYKNSEQTFVVINGSKKIHRFSSRKALFLLRPECVCRRWVIYLQTHSYPFLILF